MSLQHCLYHIPEGTLHRTYIIVKKTMKNHSTATSVNLKVLTCNLWGIFNAKVRKERMLHFATKVANYDIILLQELFSTADFETIYQALPKEVSESRYFRRFPSGVYGSGCAVISRFPIRAAFFHVYPLQGYPEMILHGDYYANKGAACIRVDVPVERNGVLSVQPVILYTTHLVAIYQRVSRLSSWKHERYLPYRISQAISLADFITVTARPTDYIIIGGDFNASQRSLEVQMLLILLKRRGYSLGSALPTPAALLEKAKTSAEAEAARRTFTFSPRNAFNASATSYFKLLNMESDLPAQIDHLFYSAQKFTLEGFPDCPDVEEGYPFYVDAGGEEAPCGVVVFTKNEVSCTVRPSTVKKLLHFLGKRLPWREVGSGVRQRSVQLLPLSDHYGVAVRLLMNVNDRESAESPQGSYVVTVEEALVVDNVIHFLEEYSQKLRHQVAVTCYMTLVSAAIVGTNVFALHLLSKAQEARTVFVMQQVYQLGSLTHVDAPTHTAREDQSRDIWDNFVAISKQWGLKALHAVNLEPRKSPAIASEPSSATPNVDFTILFQDLAKKTLWTDTRIAAAVNIGASLVAVGSMMISMIHRLGNAKLLEEQVHLLRTA